MKIFETLKKYGGTVARSSVYLRCGAYVDNLISSAFARLRLGDKEQSKSHHVLVPPLGRGNIGDQAMLDAYLDNVEGPIAIVLAKRGDLIIRECDLARVRIVELPNLFGVTGRLRARIGLMPVLLQAATLSIIGADIMDGGYSRRVSDLRISLLRLAVGLGVESQVLGFSWKDDADPYVCAALSHVHTKVRLISRDPVSYQRMLLAGFSSVVPGADLVFATDKEAVPGDVQSWLLECPEEKFAIVNASGLIDQRVNLDGDYTKLITWYRGNGYGVVVLPHVIRTGDDDRVVTRRLRKSIALDDGIHFVDRQLSPQEVSWLSARANSIITGRMHLSVMALRAGRPALVLATQGKVEGLLELFDSPESVLAPEPGFAQLAIEELKKLNEDSKSQSLEEAAQKCTELAQANFELPRIHAGRLVKF